MNERAMTAPGWYRDPSGRHELRWWDGGRWWDAVVDHGIQGEDPLVPITEHQQAISETAGIADDPAVGDSGAVPVQRVPSPQVSEQDQRNQGQPEASARRHDEPASTSDQRSDPRAEGAASTIGSVSSGAADAKVTMFSAKKIATELQAETKVLRERVETLENVASEFGALDAAVTKLRIDALQRQEADARAHAAEQQRDAAKELASIQIQITKARVTLASVEQEILVARDRVVLEEKGLFDYEHVAESSGALAAELADVRAQIKETNRYDRAIHATTGFLFNSSAAKGKAFVNQMRRIMLRAYNAEAENAVKTVKTGNLTPALKRLGRARHQIEKQGTMIDLRVDGAYHRLREREIGLAAHHHEAVAAEKALERERREELREQRRAEQELKAEKERLQKERAHYLNSIRRLRAAGEESRAEELEAQLAGIDEAIAQADYRAANIRAGYVYVISNIGAFGEGIVKIGMTRRLEPMDRVKELGDASVPFTFDVHALFFSDDAVSVEAALHREFARQRLNQVNSRKEFFRVTPEQVLDALHKHHVSVLEFRTDADADEYRTSQAILTKQSEGSYAGALS